MNENLSDQNISASKELMASRDSDEKALAMASDEIHALNENQF